MDILIGNKQVFSSWPLSDFIAKDEVGNVTVFIREVTDTNHYFSSVDKEKGLLYICWGSVYTIPDGNDLMHYLIECYHKGPKYFLNNVDGDLLFFVVDKNGVLSVITDRVGIMPIYHRMYEHDFVMSTDLPLLMQDFTKEDLDFDALNDFLHFGTMLGCYTMSKKVKLLQAGKQLTREEGVISEQMHFILHHNDTDYTEDQLLDMLENSIYSAIKKRFKGKEDGLCMLMSGGMDSRMLLAAINKVLDKKIALFTFGQRYAEEVDVARKCAEVNGNPFRWIKLTPKDFLTNATQYEVMTGGGDMFPQSYVISAVQQFGMKRFTSGAILGPIFGGTFLNDAALQAKGTLKEYLSSNHGLLKMGVFKTDELQSLLKEDRTIRDLFKVGDTNLQEIAEMFDGVSIANGIQSLTMYTRSLRLVFLRDTIPSHFLDSSYILNDIDFLKAISNVPARFKANHYLYQKLFMRIAPEYAAIPYNNTTLPISSPISMWKDGTKGEYQRELLYEKIIKDYNTTHEDKMYYPHFYSDFNGYSRYDNDWKDFFNEYLFKPNSYIYEWFDIEKVKEMYESHLLGEVNHRKRLVYLVSLELFLRSVYNK